jgi:hypothetical protein
MHYAMSITQRHVHRSDGVVLNTPPDAFEGGFGELVDRLARRMPAGGVVILDQAAAAALKFPAKLPRSTKGMDNHQALTGVRERGWRVSALSAWMTVWGERRPTLHIAVAPWVNVARVGSIWTDDAAELVARLHLYRELTGADFHTHAGVAGIGIIRDVCPMAGKEPYWRPDWKAFTEHTRRHGEVTEKEWGSWRRLPTAAEHGSRYAHSYDLRWARLAAEGAANLAVGALRPTGPREFNRNRAGYWLVDLPPWYLGNLLPHPAGPGKDAADVAWLSTPTVELLYELAEYEIYGEPVILDSWTAEGARILRPFSELIRDALNAPVIANAIPGSGSTGEAVGEALKATYRQMSGMITRPGARIHRPDWAHTFIGTERANLFRKMLKAHRAGRNPIEIETDKVTYLSEQANPREALPPGFTLPPPGQRAQLGHVQHKATSVHVYDPEGEAL